ncbi:MAG: hypothetical protein KatS3mg023_3769 [Armatimonadota bacterium]|jgi:hypothetical protein|nr:MAG: hypothetical protein KatS3mg023_3769 [Armatimonadota bacterium]
MYNTNPQYIIITCPCGSQVQLELVGGQYQNTYDGECPRCGTRWELTNVTAEMADDIEEDYCVSQV